MIDWPTVISDVLEALRWYDYTAEELARRVKVPELVVVCALTGPCLTGAVVLEPSGKYRRVW